MRYLLSVLLLMSFMYGKVVEKHYEYRWDILNEEIKIDKEIITVGEFFNIVENQTGYRVKNRVEELDENKRFVDLGSLKILGRMFDEILSGVDAMVDVDVKNHLIEIVYPEHLYVELPYNWDMQQAKRYFEKLNPWVRVYVAGNRLEFYGLKRDIEEIADIVNQYVNKAFKKYEAIITIYPYCTNDRSMMFIGKRKYYGSEDRKPIKSMRSIIKHGDIINVCYKDFNMNFKVDIQNEEIVYEDIAIPFYKLYDLGFVFRVKDDRDSFIYHLLNPDDRCDHVIVVIDISDNKILDGIYE